MAYSLVLENSKGEQIQLTQNPNYSVISVSGLNPPTSNINTAVNANFDGSIYKSSRMNARNIVIELAIEGNVEANRIALYRYIKSKKQCTVYYKNTSRNVSIVGYVEGFEIKYFDEKETVQISIMCPRPYFIDKKGTDITFSSINALFEFPFSIPAAGIEFSTLNLNEEINIVNGGDIETGLIIVFHAVGEVSNPTIYNVETRENLKVNISMNNGDTLTIDTRKGSKRIIKTVNGVEINALNYLDTASTWLALESGDNIMIYTADTHPENLMCDIVFNNLYEGV